MNTRLRILLADDSSRSLLQLGSALRSAGCLVTTANSGVLALEVLEKQDFDLALVDADMPEVSGLEVLESINGRDVDFPVVMLVDRSGDYLDLECTAFELGATDVLYKPIDPREIRDLVFELLLFDLGSDFAVPALAGGARSGSPSRLAADSEGDAASDPNEQSRKPWHVLPKEGRRELVLEALEQNGWHRELTADALGVSQATLYRHMKDYGLSKRSTPSPAPKKRRSRGGPRSTSLGREVVVDALNQTRWSQTEAAELLGISYSTLLRVRRRLGIPARRRGRPRKPVVRKPRGGPFVRDQEPGSVCVDQDWLKGLRKHLGFSRRQLALLVGCSPSAVAAWEYGRARPTEVFRCKLLELGCRERRHVREELRSIDTAKRRGPPPKIPRKGERAVLLEALRNAGWDRREASKALGVSHDHLNHRLSATGLTRGANLRRSPAKS